MSDPRFYWEPDASGSLETIDLGEGLTDFQELPGGVRVEDSYNGANLAFRSFQGASRLYRITLERFGTPGSSPLERKLLNMETHLQRGGYVGFSRDHAKTWAAVVTTPPTRGDIVLHTGTGSGFRRWAPLATVVEGDEMVLESPPAEWNREFFLCGLTGGGGSGPPTKIGIPDNGAVYTYNEYPVVRWRDFIPTLRMPKSEVNRPYVPHDHRRNWTLNLVLEYNPAAVIALFNSGSGYSIGFNSYPSVTERGGFGLSGLSMRGPDDLGGTGTTMTGVLGPQPTRGRF